MSVLRRRFRRAKHFQRDAAESRAACGVGDKRLAEHHPLAARLAEQRPLGADQLHPNVLRRRRSARKTLPALKRDKRFLSAYVWSCFPPRKMVCERGSAGPCRQKARRVPNAGYSSTAAPANLAANGRASRRLPVCFGKWLGSRFTTALQRSPSMLDAKWPCPTAPPSGLW